MLDKGTAQELSKKLKIDLFTVYREYLQLLFLKYFYSQKGTEKVFFKGGTALRFLFDSFRFSEDLDFTSLLPKTKIKILIKKTIKSVGKEIEGIRFQEIKSIADSFSGKIYQEIPDLKFPLTVKLDFSLRERPLKPKVSLIETEFPVAPYPQVSHLAIEELAAEKVRAILTRAKGRDVFDLYFILSKKTFLDWRLVNKKMVLYKRKADLNQLKKIIEKISSEDLKQDLSKFLPSTHRNLTARIKELTLAKLENG